ncbi:MAG: peptidylprolyl isomerase [Myxococcota bacterium]
MHTKKRSDREERPVLVYIGDAPIYLDEFQRELGRVSLDGEEGLPSVEGAATQRKALLNNMIDRRLLLREAEKHNVIVGMDEVDAADQRARHGWKPEGFEAELAQKDLTTAELKRELRDQLMIRKYFRDHVFSRVAVTDQEIEAHLEAHPERHIIPEEVRALQIVVKTQEEAKEWLLEIRHGMPFEDAAMKYSLSPEGKSGGDLGFFPRGVMPAIFDDICFALRTNEVSAVVPSDYGFHIFKVVDRRPEKERPTDQVRDLVEDELRREKEREAQLNKIAELRKAAKIVINDDLLAQMH